MPKQMLTGSLDEQCAFLYDLAVTKMGEGNYTGAAHALKEIVKYNPGYRDAAQLLAEAKQRKSAQSWLLWSAIGGAALGIGLGTVLQVRNDLMLLALALIGALAGFLLSNLALGLRRRDAA
jgi:hypothetical protein